MGHNLWFISYDGVRIPVKRLCVADLMIAAEPGSGSSIQDHSGSSELELFSTENFDGSGSTSSFQSEIRLVSGFSFHGYFSYRKKTLRFLETFVRMLNMIKNEDPKPYWIPDVVHDIPLGDLDLSNIDLINGTKPFYTTSKVKVGQCEENPCQELPIKETFYKNYGSVECKYGFLSVICTVR